MEIRPICCENRKVAESLMVKPFQIDYIESVKDCLLEADVLKDWVPVGLYVDDTMVGFSMFGRIAESRYTRVWFDRFLIDARFQNLGYGSVGFELVLNRILELYPGEDIFLSVYDENVAAIHLYEKFGFEFNGELDLKGERIMCLANL